MASKTVPLFDDLPASIEPMDCESHIVTCLSAPACSANVRGFEVEYSQRNGWTKCVREDTDGD